MHIEPVFTTVAVVFEAIGAFAMCVGFVVAVVLGVIASGLMMMVKKAPDAQIT